MNNKSFKFFPFLTGGVRNVATVNKVYTFVNKLIFFISDQSKVRVVTRY